MKNWYRHFIAVVLAVSFPIGALAEAPVVDESENYAMLDEQQLAVDQPLADETIALAQDVNPVPADNVELLDKIRAMQQEIQELRGQIEVQANTIKTLQQQQLTFYKDIDARLSKDNQPQTNPVTMNQPTTTKPAIDQPMFNQPALNRTAISNPADEQVSYLAAYDLVKNKQFDEALKAMQQFVNTYPQGGYTANAQYWLGELYMVKKNYPQAISHFETVLKQFPNSSKAAACTLKIGYALAASGKEAEAKQRLQQVLKNYPDTPTAQLAAMKLQSISAL